MKNVIRIISAIALLVIAHLVNQAAFKVENTPDTGYIGGAIGILSLTFFIVGVGIIVDLIMTKTNFKIWP